VPRRPLAVLTLIAGLAAAGAPAALAWDDPTPITPAGGNASATGAAVSMDASGHATVIYAYAPDIVADNSFGIVAATHTVGDAVLGNDIWNDARNVSVTNGVNGQTDSNGAPRMAVGVGPTGTAMAVWTQGGALVSAFRPVAGQPWNAPVSLTANPSSPSGPSCPDNVGTPSPPALAINPQGAGHIGWMGPCTGQSSTVPIITRAFDANGLAATGFTTDTSSSNSEGGSSFAPALAESPRGDEGAVAYSHDLNGAGAGIVEDTIAVTPANQHRTGQRYLSHASAGAIPTSTRVAYLPDGRRIVAWKETSGALDVSIGGGTVTTIPTPGQNILGLTLAAGADGTAVLGWADGNGGAVWAAVRSPDGTVGAPAPGAFGPPHQLSDTDGSPGQVRTAVAANGVGYAVWSRDTGALRGIEGAILDPQDPDRAPGTPWQFQPVPDTIINGGFQSGIPAGTALAPALAVDPAGNAEVLAPVQVVGGFTRYALAAAESASPRPVVPAGPGPDGGGGGAPSPAPAPGAPAPTPGAPAAVPPVLAVPAKLVINAFQLTRNYFGAGSKEGKRLTDPDAETLTGRHPAEGLRAGTKINFTLSEAAKATVTVAFDGCFDDTASKRASGSRTVCTKKLKSGVVYYKKTISGKRGKNTLTFLGTNLPNHRHLAAGGQYRVSVTGKDPHSGKTVAASRVYFARIDAAV
jgi:hypothetical protein